SYYQSGYLFCISGRSSGSPGCSTHLSVLYVVADGTTYCGPVEHHSMRGNRIDRHTHRHGAGTGYAMYLRYPRSPVVARGAPIAATHPYRGRCAVVLPAHTRIVAPPVGRRTERGVRNTLNDRRARPG